MNPIERLKKISARQLKTNLKYGPNISSQLRMKRLDLEKIVNDLYLSVPDDPDLTILDIKKAGTLDDILELMDHIYDQVNIISRERDDIREILEENGGV